MDGLKWECSTCCKSTLEREEWRRHRRAQTRGKKTWVLVKCGGSEVPGRYVGDSLELQSDEAGLGGMTERG